MEGKIVLGHLEKGSLDEHLDNGAISCHLAPYVPSDLLYRPSSRRRLSDLDRLRQSLSPIGRIA